MTPHQANLLEFVRSQIEIYGVSPSYAEMAHALGVRSRSMVVAVVKALIRDGHLRRAAKGQPRGLRLPGVNLRIVTTAALVAELERREVVLVTMDGNRIVAVEERR